MSMSSGDFKYQVSFHSSHRNVADAVVQILVHCGVFSKRIESWRSEFPEIVTSDSVAGGQLGNLVNPQVNSVWNIADPATRDSEIANIVSSIESVGLAYFARFEDLATLHATMLTEDVPSMTIDRVLEYLICFTDRDSARIACINFLQRRPDLIRSYKRDYQRYAERGLSWSTASGFAKQLAFASHLFRFGDLASVAG